MIKLFDVQNGIVVPTEHSYTLKDLQFIREKYPNDFLKVYQYCFYMCCYHPDLNPFYNVREEDREDVIMQQLDPPFTTEDEGIQEALQLCKKLYETPTLRAFIGIKTGLENLADLLKDTKPVAGGKEANADSLLKIAERYDKVRQSYKGTEKDLLAEQKSRVRGGGGLAYDQDGGDDDDDD